MSSPVDLDPDRDLPTTDGRRLRRERGRRAAIDATIDLVLEGEIPPSAEQIAERAGLSVATVFRYFETLEDLRRAVAAVYLERSAVQFAIPSIGDGDLAGRVTTFVTARLALYEASEPIARLIRRLALDGGEADAILHQLRAARVAEVRRQFDPELRARTPAIREDVAMIVSTLTSFEAWDQARHDHDRSPAQIRRAWIASLTKVLLP